MAAPSWFTSSLMEDNDIDRNTFIQRVCIKLYTHLSFSEISLKKKLFLEFQIGAVGFKPFLSIAIFLLPPISRLVE